MASAAGNQADADGLGYRSRCHVGVALGTGVYKLRPETVEAIRAYLTQRLAELQALQFSDKVVVQ